MANTSKNTPAATHEDRWTSGKRRDFFRRGVDRSWHFSGQDPNEHVLMVVRRHWWFLIPPGLPFIGSIVFLLIVTIIGMSIPTLGFIWILLEIIALLALVVTGVMFSYRDLVSWWYETYIITDKRIINARGLLEPTRQQTPIDKVSQVGVGVETMLGWFLGFGTVHVYLAGGDFYIRDVPRPNAVRDAIIGLTQNLQTKKKPDAPARVPKDPDMIAVLEALGKGKPVPTLPNADENLPPLRSQDRFLGPRRTFGGILRIPCNVRYVSGEYTVKYVQRSRYVLWRKQIVPILSLFVLVPTMLLVPGSGILPPGLWVVWWLGMSVAVLACAFTIGLFYFNYIDDVYILTNRRVIDIERFFFFFYERSLEAEYKSVRDIRVKVPNVVQRFFDVGSVYVETPGSNPDIVLEGVDHPFVLQDEILAIKNHKDKVDAANRENSEKQNLSKWFNQVIVTMEDTAKGRGTPDLRNMDLFTAMACAQELSLDVTVSGEAVETSIVQPGHVVTQSPPPGTIMEKGSKIEIVLSRRPVLVDSHVE